MSESRQTEESPRRIRHGPQRQAIELAEQGRYREALALLEDVYRKRPDFDPAARMVNVRLKAFEEEPPKSHASPGRWPPSFSDPFESCAGLPEIRPDELSTATLGGAIHHHGGLLVRGLLRQERTERLLECLKLAREGMRRTRARNGRRDKEAGYARAQLPHRSAAHAGRHFVEKTGSVLMVDAPFMFAEFIEALRETNVPQAIEDYFGEPPILSAGKTTARCTPASIKEESKGSRWHQDGSFMGEHIRTINLWIALTPCGIDASGLDLVPRRFDHVLPTGGSVMPIEIIDSVVQEAAGDAGTQTPVFQAGDAVLFDHLFVHRTGLPDGMYKDRYAIESWFFAPAAYPADQVPVLF